MAQFFKAKKPVKKTGKAIEITIEQFNHDGQGIGYINNKICFVEGALPGERIKVQLVEDKAKMAKARSLKIIEANAQRIKPACQHFTQCGGCQLQYATHEYQLQIKREAVGGLFKRFAQIDTLPWQNSLTSLSWHYRRAARIGVWYDNKSKQFTVGFRQRNSKQLTAITQCDVLVDEFNTLFSAFTDILPKLKVGRDITHLEVIKADNANVVVVRHTRVMPAKDKLQLIELAQQNNWLIVSEYEKGQVEMLDEGTLPELYYLLKSSELQLQPNVDDSKLTFRIGDFIQVNAAINEQMIAQAIHWLALEKTDIVLDLFCGIGNFSLPMASVCDKVVGVEGVDSMVQQASHNAAINDIKNAEFYQADLSENKAGEQRIWLNQPFNKVLLDPARAGAEQIMATVARMKPQKILYVSCEPLTLARDSSVLVNCGYQIKKIALMDMFSHTRHVEVMVLFEQKG